ncbi:inorganic diphosphatase [Actinocatenispora sera]|uniref:Inorganic pyrophosphatase n=1 Tax=Actinocatenispora sera TaxID=390989 RepID=A0A810KZ74_9ACTN|nr:inorganic diphosphatase [Actinocatenispora sera]BCJ27521.1 inorganic pyrophosphatase [Actinocatenispora sera]
MEFDMVVEIPAGSRNKYEMDHRTGRIRLDRTLFTATRYPADYGFVPDSLGEDDDPLDAMVLLLDEPTFPGCVIAVRPVAVFWMRDEHGPDAKVMCVPAGDDRYDHIRDIGDLPRHLRDEISHFFNVYKALEPGKDTEIRGWQGRLHAEAEVNAAWERAAGEHL